MTLQNKEYSNLGLIVAMGQNGEIGCQNDLIWRIKEDLTFFKNTTMDSYIIMGRKTYDSMPKNLKGRRYIVLSRDNNFVLDSPKIVHHNVDETLSFVSQDKDSRFLVVGGGAIYNLFLPYVSFMHITQIKDSFEKADTYFPSLNKEEWNQQLGENMQSEDGINYRHTVLIRKIGSIFNEK